MVSPSKKKYRGLDRKINAESFHVLTWRIFHNSISSPAFPGESFRSQVILQSSFPSLIGFLYRDSWILSISHVDFSMESRNKLHSRLRLWEFPDQYVIEPADDGSGAPCLDISRVDASMKLIGSFFFFVSSKRSLKSMVAF